MNEIKFNVPLNYSKSRTNLLNFLKKQKPIHGPGENIIKIKKIIKKNFNFKNIFLTNSCTSALEICALALRLKKTDEVLLPSFAFITTASSFARVNCKLRYYDVQKDNLMPNYQNIINSINKNTKVVIILHYQGYSINFLDELKKYCLKKKIYLVEDAAQAFGSFFKKKPLGSFGDFSCFSFHETKNIHSGAGGMLVVNNKKFLNKISAIFDKGTNRFLMLKNKVNYYSWIEIGSAFLMTELTASFLLPQIKDNNFIIKKRKILHERYKNNLAELDGKKIFLTSNYKYKYNYHAFVIIIKKNNRENFLKYLKKKKINAVISYTPLHKSKMGKKFLTNKDLLLNTNKYINRVVRLPLHNSLQLKDIDYICNIIKEYFLIN